MSEKVVVRQNRDFLTEILATDPHRPGDSKLYPVEHLYHLTPYGMLLASLGTCTAIVLHTYAQHHGVDLEEVELRLSYERIFADDCRDCEAIDTYEEQIVEEIALKGHLSPQERQKLLLIARHCPIHKMLHQGIEVVSHLSES
ncbi:MAG: OsmC family protein [Anaerolineae bacterium]|nr:OsmC family protein [Anaerolineae bacterium]MCX8066442.1 OsmC family protein [Anaerolineae bacterium]MDW7992170.1 OsmC family protein [Anaerolineae bacterium]